MSRLSLSLSLSLSLRLTPTTISPSHLEAIVREDAPQVGVAVEVDAVHVERLALEPVGRAEEIAYARHALVAHVAALVQVRGCSEGAVEVWGEGEGEGAGIREGEGGGEARAEVRGGGEDVGEGEDKGALSVS